MGDILYVPDDYATLVEAYSAASNGDTVVLAPGWHGFFAWNKAVNLKGNTEDPVNNPVDIRIGSTAHGFFGSGTSEVWIEGVNFHSSTSSSTNSGKLAGTNTWHFSRCQFLPTGYRFNFIFAIEASCSAIFENCYLPAITDYTNKPHFYTATTNDGPIYFLRTETNYKPWKRYKSGIYVNITPIVDDSVTSATTNYGPSYGTWYFAQFAGASYRIAGVVAGDNLTKEDTQVYLFRTNDEGNMERLAWKTTTPDANTGDWEFVYLPVSNTYYVALVPPAGNEPKMIGPYTPVQA